MKNSFPFLRSAIISKFSRSSSIFKAKVFAIPNCLQFSTEISFSLLAVFAFGFDLIITVDVSSSVASQFHDFGTHSDCWQCNPIVLLRGNCQWIVVLVVQFASSTDPTECISIAFELVITAAWIGNYVQFVHTDCVLVSVSEMEQMISISLNDDRPNIFCCHHSLIKTELTCASSNRARTRNPILSSVNSISGQWTMH